MSPKEIKAKREDLGLSPEGLADRAQLSLRTVERIEAGDVTPHRSTLRVIELALNAFAAEQAATGATA